MSRLKAGLHLGSAISFKVLAGLLVIKVLAWELGTEGFGLLGQLMTLVAIAGMLAGGGISNGLIKVLAKTPITDSEGKAWFAAAFSISAFTSLMMALMLCVFSGMLSEYFIPDVGAFLFFALAFSQVIIAFGNLSLAEASSRGDMRAYSLINISGTIAGVCLIIVATKVSGFVGSAYAVVLMPSMIGVVALAYLLVRRREVLACFCWVFEFMRMKHLMSFSLVTLIGALSVPLSQLFVRDVMGNTLGWDSVGLWQGVVKISDVYMQFVGVVLINYVLPRYSAAKNLQKVLREWFLSVSALICVLLVCFLVFYFLRSYIISFVFSDSFLPMQNFLAPQMAGDVFRTLAASISYIFMARGAVRVSFVFELMQGVIFFCIFNSLIGWLGAMAPVYAHLVTYFSLSLVMIFGLLFFVNRGSS